MLTYPSLLQITRIEQPPASWSRHADNALSRPLQDLLPTAVQLRQTAGAYPLPPEQIRQLDAMRRRIDGDPVLSGLFSVWYTVFFIEKDASAEAYDRWPVPSSLDESEASLFRALVIFSGTAGLEQALHEHGLTAYRQACLNDYIENTCRHFDRHGVYGLLNEKMWWLWPVFLGRVFRVGRLSYEIGEYRSAYLVFRHHSGRHLLLAGELEQTYDETGHQAEHGEYQPVYTKTETFVRGNAFNEDGTFNPDPVTLDLSEWSSAVQPGDPIIHLHIPGDGKLYPQAVQDSLKAAVPFFRQHFPELSFRLFVCHSWLLNTGLAQLLPADSNILSFQSLFTLALANQDKDAIYSFIFDVPPCPLEQLAPRTSFHTRVLAFIRNGGCLWDGFGVFPFDYL